MTSTPEDGRNPGGGNRPNSPLQAAVSEALGAFSKDPGAAARRMLDAADRALKGAGGASAGRDPLAGLAAAASRFVSEMQAPAPGRPAGEGGEPPLGERRGEAGGVAPVGVPAQPQPSPFVGLRQRDGDWLLHVRAEAVDAVAPAGDAGCALHLSDGTVVEAGESSDEAARSLPRLVRLSQAGTQRGVYVRAAAVLAVSAPPEGGCVLRFRGGRELPAAEAAAVAVGLLAAAEA